MRRVLNEYFEGCKIEYYGVLPYDACREISPHIAKRAGFVPKSVIVYIIPYYTGPAENISCYAASLDYHGIIAKIGAGLSDVLRAVNPDANVASFGDHSPIDERHAASILGLGLLGDNYLLLNEKYGSYIFIGDVVTDIPAEILGADEQIIPGHCPGCGRCRAACPSGILRGESDSCLSAITQRKGILLPEEEEMMRKFNTGWGCDICQSACPFNKSPILTPIEYFYNDRISRLDRETLDAMSDEELKSRAFGWRGRAVLERNLRVLFGSDDDS